ncbi:MAG: site-specific DNA-methyltransferase [Candidatus Dormibacteraeota bacterium]|nr:site-specific DNA-methyltransferase [Candidatus Dormibacteraeota bacterium]
MTAANQVIEGDCLEVLASMPASCVDLIYVDPPFNTGSPRSHARVKTRAALTGTRTGFGGRRYEVTSGPTRSFADAFDDYTGWLEPRLAEAHRVLRDNGSLYLHVDYREVHYCKVMLDRVFGRRNFINEIIWAYDFGGRGRRRWPAKHDNILFYARDAGDYVFNIEDIDRTPYMAPGLVTAEKAARGKLPTDTWWHTIVPTSGTERTGYPTQKPLGVVSRIVRASSPPGGTVLDFFCGSGTTAVAAHQAGRRFVVVDSAAEAIAVTRRRLDGLGIPYLPSSRSRLSGPE